MEGPRSIYGDAVEVSQHDIAAPVQRQLETEQPVMRLINRRYVSLGKQNFSPAHKSSYRGLNWRKPSSRMNQNME